MKTFLLSATLVVMGYCGYAQTKGTNALGFGIRVSEGESNQGQDHQEQSNNEFSLSYGHFIKEKVKLSFTGSYGITKNEQANNQIQFSTKFYGGRVAYQKYFNVAKKFFVYADGGAGLMFNKSSFTNGATNQDMGTEYSLNAYGGAAYFLSKHIAFEATLIRAGALYYTSKRNDAGSRAVSKSFNLSSSGSLSNMAFQIYFLF